MSDLMNDEFLGNNNNETDGNGNIGTPVSEQPAVQIFEENEEEATHYESGEAVSSYNKEMDNEDAVSETAGPVNCENNVSTVGPEMPYPSAVPVETKKAKREKKVKNKEGREKGKTPFGVKILATAAFGLVFGVFFAGGFYGVNQLLGANAAIEQGSSSDIEDMQKEIAALQNAVKNSNTATAVTTSTVVSSSTDITNVVDKVMPSMVSVTNLYEEVTYYWGRQYAQEQEASGSGIIIGENDKEYLIATNYHVIEDCKELTIQFVDDTKAEAYVKGYDSNIDIAVIAVSKDNLENSTKYAITVAELGDSDSLKMGETAIAIGNALGYAQSVTTGVISALNREIDLENSVSDLIQTSAAINPGNSGGALLNVNGEVIGINSSKIGSTTVEGMGFAIPINEVKDILVEFSNRETKDKVAEDKRGYLGIAGRSCSDIGLTAIGYPDGAYISEVYANSAAEAAGIYAGDIVTKANGQSIDSIEELQEVLSYCSIGDSVTLSITRRVDGKLDEITVDVVLGDRSAITNAEQQQNSQPEQDSSQSEMMPWK